VKKIQRTGKLEWNSLLVGQQTSLREKIIWMEQLQKLHDQIAENRVEEIGKPEVSSQALSGD